MERDETAREIARIEREAAKQHQREDKMGMAGQGVAAPLSEARAERMAQLEASMAEAKQQREEARALSALPHGWSEAVNPDGKSFYTHLASGAVQWERPVASEAGVGGWEQGWTETGVPYYFNLQKGVTQWEARHLSNLSSQPLRAFVSAPLTSLLSRRTPHVSSRCSSRPYSLCLLLSHHSYLVDPPIIPLPLFSDRVPPLSLATSYAGASRVVGCSCARSERDGGWIRGCRRGPRRGDGGGPCRGDRGGPGRLRAVLSGK